MVVHEIKEQWINLINEQGRLWSWYKNIYIYLYHSIKSVLQQNVLVAEGAVLLYAHFLA